MVLEKGDIEVHVRPVVNRDAIEALVDVQELLLGLRPDGAATTRWCEVGRKRMPAVDEDTQNWAYVRGLLGDDELADATAASTYETSTRGTQEQAGTRVVAEGSYVLERSGRDTHLVLDVDVHADATVGDLTDVLHLEPEGRYVVSVKNPRASTDDGVGLDRDERADLPDDLQAVFDGNRWAPADPPALLDHEGTEFLLIGVDS